MNNELQERAFRLTRNIRVLDTPPYEVVGSYKRFDQKFNMVVRGRWDDELRKKLPGRGPAKIRNMQQNVEGYTLKDYALAAGARVLVQSLGTNHNRANSGLTSWDTLWSDRDVTAMAKPTVIDSTKMATTIKEAAQYLGAALVGIAYLDRRWVYSHHFVDGTSIPVDIPDAFKYVIAMGVEMDYERMNKAPNAIMYAEVGRIYSRMALLVASLATFIRGLGYQAIPSLNDTALNVPIAVDAGLGQQGRTGLLITPAFGPRQRLCKVITDMPLQTDKPIDFGVTEFCESCEQCARNCPTQAIQYGTRTTDGPTVSNNPGVRKWYLNPEKCITNWSRTGTNCGICIKVCPFNQQPRDDTSRE